MAITLSDTIISPLQRGESGDSFTETLIYDLTDGENLFQLWSKMPNHKARSSLYPGFRVKDATADMIAGSGSNGAKIEITWEYSLSSLGEPEESEIPDPELPPWQWPVQDYRVSSVEIEESVDYLWVKKDDQVQKIPFQTTAGTELTATRPRGIRSVSFSYNLQNFDETIVNPFIGAVNFNSVRIASVNYGAGTVQMKSISATPYVVKNDDGTTKWRYYKIDVSFWVDPKTFNREYPNASTRFIPPGGKGHAQIWCCEIDDELYFGTRKQIIEKSETASKDSEKWSPESVTEPMFLDLYDGKISSWHATALTLDDPKQEPTFVSGCPYDLVDFGPLQLPANKNMT